MKPLTISPVARSVPFDPTNTEFTSTVRTVQEALEQAVLFGARFQAAESLNDSTTTSLTVWSTKVTLTPSSALLQGNYLLLYVCTATAGTNREVDVRVRQNNTTLFEVRESVVRNQGSNTISGFVPLTSVSGTPTFTLEFKVGGTATTVTVSNARLVLWRIA
jgi:hypothetical protein